MACLIRRLISQLDVAGEINDKEDEERDIYSGEDNATKNIIGAASRGPQFYSSSTTRFGFPSLWSSSRSDRGT
jgi:hypothetical protein